MIRSRILFTALLALVMLSSCKDRPVKVASQGAPYEILVVMPHERWAGIVGDTLRSIMQEPVEMLNSEEPKYSLAQMNPRSFEGFITQHRNVLVVNTNDKLTEPTMVAEYDRYSSPQIIVHVASSDAESLSQYMSDHRAELQAIFEIAERERSLALNKRTLNQTISGRIKEKFGFSIEIPKDYITRNTLQDFMWISKEYPLSSQGMIVYSYPYTGPENFMVDSLVANRNRFVSLIPAENPGSHMITYEGFVPLLKHLRINGRYWAEIRGFWDVANDFMGGPFVSYATLDTQTRRVVVIDCYVYSPDPNKPKRNMLRQLEHVLYSVSFPGDQQIREGGAPGQE